MLPDWTDPNLTAEMKLEILEPARLKRIGATRMAELFVNCSRNSIIGFLHRQKVPLLRAPGWNSANDRPDASHKARNDRVLERKVQAERNNGLGRTPPAQVFNDDVVDPKRRFGREIDPPGQVTLMQLTEHTCRWPIGMPEDPDFGFCGAPPKAGKSYCEKHFRRGTFHL